MAQCLPDGRAQCEVCPRDCKLHAGQRGACFVLARQGEGMVLTTYGRSSGFCIDPIEKKPLNQFFPGSSVLSLGTARCNIERYELGLQGQCTHCQFTLAGRYELHCGSFGRNRIPIAIGA